MKFKISIAFLTIVLGFLIYVAVKPAAMTISRELVVNATPEALFPYLNNSKKMNDWMPWQDSDPSVHMQYSGPEEGVGSKSSWESTGKMGVGNAVIVESTPAKSVKSQLTYTKPMEMSQLAELSLNPVQEGGTLVRWSVDGHNGFFFRLFGVFMNIDKTVGGEFEKGLLKLKTLAESSGK